MRKKIFNFLYYEKKNQLICIMRKKIFIFKNVTEIIIGKNYL